MQLGKREHTLEAATARQSFGMEYCLQNTREEQGEKITSISSATALTFLPVQWLPHPRPTAPQDKRRKKIGLAAT